MPLHLSRKAQLEAAAEKQSTTRTPRSARRSLTDADTNADTQSTIRTTRPDRPAPHPTEAHAKAAKRDTQDPTRHRRIVLDRMASVIDKESAAEAAGATGVKRTAIDAELPGAYDAPETQPRKVAGQGFRQRKRSDEEDSIEEQADTSEQADPVELRSSTPSSRRRRDSDTRPASTTLHPRPNPRRKKLSHASATSIYDVPSEEDDCPRRLSDSDEESGQEDLYRPDTTRQDSDGEEEEEEQQQQEAVEQEEDQEERVVGADEDEEHEGEAQDGTLEEHHTKDGSGAADSHSEPETEPIKLTFGPVDPTEDDLVKVYCNAAHQAYILMGKAGWTGAGDGWKAKFRVPVGEDRAPTLANSFRSLLKHLRNIPSYPCTKAHDDTLRRRAEVLEDRLASINVSVKSLCRFIELSTRPAALVRDLLRLIIPIALLCLHQVFTACGMRDALGKANERRRAMMSTTTVEISQHLIGWLQKMAALVLKKKPAKGKGNASRDQLSKRLHREALPKHLTELEQKLADAKTKLVTEADLVELDREREALEEAARKEAEEKDRQVRQARAEKARARYDANAEGFRAFCRSTNDFGPNPLEEHRKRMMQFGAPQLATTPVPLTVIRSNVHGAIRPGEGEEPWEPTRVEKKLILDYVVKLNFDLEAVAAELGRSLEDVRYWKVILVQKAREVYFQNGYALDQLPDGLRG